MTHAEAPISANFVLVNKAGVNLQITLREGVTTDQSRALFDVVNKFVEYATEKGWTVPGGKASAAVAPQPQRQPAQATSGAGGSFAVSDISHTMVDDSHYFKVKGGKFEKFGVTVWPEVLADAGVDVTNLPKSWDGWTAHYITKEDGKPLKVIRLEQF